MNKGCEGRVAIVTGGAKGIGAAISFALAGDGAKVLVVARSSQAGEDVVKRIQKAGGEATFFSSDVGWRKGVADSVKVAADRYGRLDIVVHNAAYIAASDLRNLAEEDLDRTLNVNLKAAFWFTAEALSYLENSGAGRLLFTSSITGNHQSHPRMTAYGSSKAGLNGFIRQAGYELAGCGITVNGVEPGVTFSQAVIDTLTEEQKAQFASIIPCGRAAKPEEIAAAILFLAQPSAGHITGQTIVVDGGQSLGTAFPE